MHRTVSLTPRALVALLVRLSGSPPSLRTATNFETDEEREILQSLETAIQENDTETIDKIVGIRHAGGPGSGRYPKGSGGNSVHSSMERLATKYPEVAAHYDEHSGTEMGSIGSHTRDVGVQWKQEISSEELADISSRWGHEIEPLMDDALALHDIGKGIAIDAGDKSMQHEYTVPILRSVLAQEGHNEAQIDLATELLNHDMLGALIKGNSELDQHEVARIISDKAKKVGMDVKDFATLQLAVYHTDAGAYPFIRQFMHEDPNTGRSSMNRKDKIAAVLALRTLLVTLGGPGSGRYPKGSGDTVSWHGTVLHKIEQIKKEGLQISHSGEVFPSLSKHAVYVSTEFVRLKIGPKW